MNKYTLFLLLILLLGACAPVEHTYKAGVAVKSATETVPVVSSVAKEPLSSMDEHLRNDELKEDSVAVSYFYDEENGNVTALGEMYRQQLERELLATGHCVKIRKDLNLLLLDSESFGSGFDVQALKQLQADILYTGSYRLFPCGDAGGVCALLNIKASSESGASVVDSFQCRVDLPAGWARLAANVRGNVYQQQVRDVVDTSLVDKPSLSASLNREPACYVAGEAAQVDVETEPGCYLYILSLAADGSVTLLYPCSMLPQRPLVSGHFIFPPLAIQKHWQLQFYPLTTDVTSKEAIKVIASRKPIDFSWLPVPENQIYKGAKGGKLQEITRVLQQVQGWSDVVLPYYVGKDCAR